MHSLYTSWLSLKISSLTKDWLLRNLCQQLTHFLMREPGTAVTMDHHFEKKILKFSFYLMFYLLQLEFQVKSCFFGFLLRRYTGTLSLFTANPSKCWLLIRLFCWVSKKTRRRNVIFKTHFCSYLSEKKSIFYKRPLVEKRILCSF